MSNIIENFSNRKDIIKLYDWMSINKNLNNFERFKVSISNNGAIGTAFNLNVDELVTNALINELNQDLVKKIFKKAFSTPKFDYLDLRPDGSLMTGRIYLEKLVKMIISSGYKNVVTTGLIASELQDSQYFSNNGFQHASMSTTSTFYSSGKLSDVNVWVDPYMKFNDGRLCLFNQADINYIDIELKEIVSTASLTQRLQLEYNLDFEVSDSKLIFVIEDENSEAYKQYKSLQRDIKIDNILDVKNS